MVTGELFPSISHLRNLLTEPEISKNPRIFPSIEHKTETERKTHLLSHAAVELVEGDLLLRRVLVAVFGQDL